MNRYRISFSQRLFWSIFAMFLGFTTCFLLFQYQREHEFAEEKLNNMLDNYNHQLYQIINNSKAQDVTGSVKFFISEIAQKDLRVTIIDPQGKVLFDNSDASEFNNHNNRVEVKKARQQQEGYALRESKTTGIKYFYAATNINNYIYRSALPWETFTQKALTIDKRFIYFMAIMMLIFFIVLSRFTFSIGQTIARLRDFALNIENDRITDNDYHFPNDELGDISQNIITLYHRQRKLKRQLTQNVAHELKTPVSSIQGYLETILNNKELDDEKRQFFLERCYSQSTRLAYLLRDMSVLNRLDEASEMFDITEVNLSTMLMEIEKECSQMIEEKHITTNLKIRDDMIVKGNYSLLYSIFRNLFDNAIAYAGEGIHIEVNNYKEDNEYLYFKFSDNGVGIAKEHLERIFERFYRVDKGRSRKIGGTGLGLSIVKNAVNFHKGQITAESDLGKGVTFIFSLKKDCTEKESDAD
jgi:signal transduction histidine kinase